MLGNQYFMARKFEQAIPHFETTLEQYPDDLRILRKLVICYVASESLKRALDKMELFLKSAPKDYFETEQRDENCPCPEIIDRWSVNPPKALSRYEYLIAMGILDLFCGHKRSRSYFHQARKIQPLEHIIDDILEAI